MNIIYIIQHHKIENNRIDDENNKQKVFGLLTAPNLFNLSKILNLLQLINNNKKKIIIINQIKKIKIKKL